MSRFSDYLVIFYLLHGAAWVAFIPFFFFFFPFSPPFSSSFSRINGRFSNRALFPDKLSWVGVFFLLVLITSTPRRVIAVLLLADDVFTL